MKEYLWNLITYTGIEVDNAGDPYFWHTPIGFITILVIGICSLTVIVSKNIKTDLIVDICNWVKVLICGIAILHVAQNSNPRHQLQIILIALAVDKAWGIYKVFKRGK